MIHNDKKLVDKINLLLESKNFPIPLTNQNQNCLEDMAFEKYLTNRHFWEVPKNEQDLMLGDFMFLTDEAFRYYIFEVILLTLNGQNIPLMDIFLQQFLLTNSTYELHRYTQFNNDELEIIISFLEKIVLRIEDEIGDREAYNNLEDWEQVEIDPPFKNYEEEIQTALRYWGTIKRQQDSRANEKPIKLYIL